MRLSVSLYWLLLILTTLRNDVFAQFNNEWIDYNQQYLELIIEQDGWYQLSITQLEDAGLVSNNVEAELQMFHLGKQIPLYIEGETAYFFGYQNRGELDQNLYEEGEQLNPDFSLFTDQAAYYVTINIQDTSLRYELKESDINNETGNVDFVWAKESVVLSEAHFKPKVGVNRDLQASNFDIGEGFGSALSNDHIFLIRTEAVDISAPESTLNIRLAGNDTEHAIQVFWNETLLDDFTTEGYGVLQKKYKVPSSELLKTNQLVITGNNGDLDKLMIASYSLEYPQEILEVSGQKTITLNDSNANSRIPLDKEIDFFIIDQQEAIVYITQDQADFIVESTESTRRLEFVPIENILAISDYQKVKFVDFTGSNPSYIIITNDDLRRPDQTGKDEVESYADYRRSAEGGSLEVLIVDVNDLYRQFSFGIKSHPIAIKQFAQFAADQWMDVEGLFIIGKGRDYYTTRFEEQRIDNIEYVPTYGSPGSDNLLISDDGSIAPLFPVGRLAAQSPTDIRLYLDKIIEHEQQAPEDIDPLWRKRVLHLSGGSSDIVDAVAFFLKDLEDLIEQSAIGANVETFKKTSAAPIQPAQTKQLLEQINEGVSMVTFLGHSSPGTFDFSLEEPSAYENTGTLPIIISLGCHSGNIHSEGYGLSEQFVLEPQKGAIAFLASSSSNYLDTQYLTGRILYLLIGDGFYQQPIGRAIQEILILTDQLDQRTLALNEQFTLHGDPLLRLEYQALPDLQIDESSARTEPPIVTTTLDSFEFYIDVINGGRVIQDSTMVTIQHLNAAGEVLYETDKRILMPRYASTVSVAIPSPGLQGTGQNRIVVYVDSDNSIDEGEAEQNNSFMTSEGKNYYEFEIFNNEIKPVFPYNFSIVNQDKITVKASTNNALAGKSSYQLQMDTSILFNSPVLYEKTITEVQGLVQWPVTLDIAETVYYWRVYREGEDPREAEPVSFLYAPDSGLGWNQSHYYQYQENVFDGIVFNSERQLQFDTSGFFISIHNRKFNPSVPPGYQFNFENFAASVNPWLFMSEGIAVVVGDEIDGSAWENEGGSYGSIFSSSESSKRVFGFSTQSSEDREVLLGFLENIPDEKYVFLFSVIGDESARLYGENWLNDMELFDNTLIDYLESEGATLIRQLTTGVNVPYNIIYQKGIGVLGEDIASDIDESIRTDVFIPRLLVSGAMETNLIGPASQWETAEIKLDNESNDEYEFSVFGLNKMGDEELLISIDNANVLDLSSVDTKTFPFVKLRLSQSDETNRSAANLFQWRVLFEALPDLALDPDLFISLPDEGISEGLIHLGIGITNTSIIDAPPVSIEYILFKEATSDTIGQLLPALKSNESIADSITIAFESFKESKRIKIIVNPDSSIEEEHAFNNIAVSVIDIPIDDVAPVLDVYFDGIDIVDGEIISPNPVIRFEVKDQSIISNVNQFELSIRNPDGTTENIVDSPELLTLNYDELRQVSVLEFMPILQTGDYQLTASVFDNEANQSEEYQRIFKVISRKTIRDFNVFPNPMADQLQFEFYLTGDPEFTIDLFNNAGILVKQFSDVELGGLASGRNLSPVWDGKDDFGSVLPNGVYTYIIQFETDDLEYIDFIDASTAKSFGQIVLIR